MKPAILLYNPPATYDPKTWVRPYPLNVLSLCALLDEQRYELVVVQDFVPAAIQRIAPYVKNALCLGISCMTGAQITHGLEVARFVRQQAPDIPIIWGGYHPTALPDQTLAHPLVDIVVRGYGEETFAELVARLSNGEPFDDVAGISFQRGDEIVHTPSRPIPNLNALPPIPYHLFDVEGFFQKTGRRSLHYISSRGCPHQCGFCADVVIYRRRWNALSAERVLEDLERLQRTYHFDTVRFYDSNLFVSEARIRAICEGMLKRGLRFNWDNCNGDARILSRYDLSTFDLMQRAGVTNVLLGFESGYGPALECIKKAASLEENSEAVRRLHEHGISIGFSFMFGFPYDLPASVREQEHLKELQATIESISELSQNWLPGDYYLWFAFTPYPGVRLYPRYLKLGYQPPKDLESWGRVNLNENRTTTWVSPKAFRAFDECLQMKWYFMHELRKALQGPTPGPRRNAWAERLDQWACRWLRRRIARHHLRVPLVLKLTEYAVLSVQTIRARGIKGFLKKLGIILRTDAPEKRFLKGLFR